MFIGRLKTFSEGDDVEVMLEILQGLGSTVEWRLRGGEPFAAILRFKESHPDGGEMEWLGVFKVGTEGQPGCLVEWVGSSAQPSQNEAARTVADTKAVQHTCGA